MIARVWKGWTKAEDADAYEKLLREQEGSIENRRVWVGILKSPNGWKTIETKYSDDYKRKKLIYQGSSGSTIMMAYRVFRAGSTMPEQQESLTFDLSKSDVIIVRDFRLKVLMAKGDSISYIVIND